MRGSGGVGTWEELEKGEREIEFDVKRYLCMKFSKKYHLNKKAITGNYIKLRNTRGPMLKFWLSARKDQFLLRGHIQAHC